MESSWEVSCESLDGSIVDVLAALLGKPPTEFVLVRTWDSGRDPASIAKDLAHCGVASLPIGAGALVDLRVVDLETLSAALFGFDELWFGDETTQWSALESVPQLTSDRVNFTSDDGAPFERGLLTAGAEFALADGCGLNFVRRLGTGEAGPPGSSRSTN